MSVTSPFSEFLSRDQSAVGIVVRASGFPPPAHPTEPDLHCRQSAMPDHDQARLENAHIAIVGCGGLGSWIALGLARMGVRRLTLIDPDRFDRSNAPRQLLFPEDLGRFKAAALAHNLAVHMTNAGAIAVVTAAFDDATELSAEVGALIVGVDNNRARLAGARFGLQRKIPVIFCMLSRDGLRAQVFLQEPGGPCLKCVLPNLEPDSAAPCAAASIGSCYLAAAHTLQLLTSSLTSYPMPPWRESSLDGTTERIARPSRRPNCEFCGP